MNKLFLKLILISFLLCIPLIDILEPQIPAPYIKRFNPIRRFTVSNGVALRQKLNTAQPGDLIQLTNGTYLGTFVLHKAGTIENPIVIKGLGRVGFNGGFRVRARNNYIMGIEFSGGRTGIDLFCAECGAINNVIHDVVGSPGLGAWDYGANQVIYGNIIYKQVPNNNNPHNIYTQNRFTENGYKYFISNVVVDVATENTFNFHGYTEGGYTSGFHLERNVFANGTVLVGSTSNKEPDHHHLLRQNYFYKADARIGYHVPIQFKFQNNYLGRSTLRTEYMWGTGETTYTNLLTEPSEITGNTIVLPERFHMHLGTANSSQPAGGPRFRPGDISNNNRFIKPGKGFYSLNAGGLFYATITGIVDWRDYTQESGGMAFDINSVEVPSEPTKQFFIQNEYDPNRGFLVVYNWKKMQGITFQHPGTFDVFRVRQPFGPPVVTGTNSVRVPLSGEFEVFLVKDRN
jgi:hypothetical protein